MCATRSASTWRASATRSSAIPLYADATRAGWPGFLLHASRIEWTDPTSGAALRDELALPASWQPLLERLATGGPVSATGAAMVSHAAMPGTRLHLLFAAALLLPAVTTASTVRAEPPVVSSNEVMRAHPVDPAQGAAITEILRGEQASVNVWQITDAMAPHLHRTHEEVIIVRSGRARARIGDRDVDLGPGDVLLVPKNTVHAARAIGEEPFVGVSVFAPAFDGRDRVPVPTPQP